MRIKRYRREKNGADLTKKNRVFCIALLKKSNLDKATKKNIENIGRVWKKNRPSGIVADIQKAYVKWESDIKRFV